MQARKVFSKQNLAKQNVAAISMALVLSCAASVQAKPNPASQNVSLQKNGITIWEVPVKNSNHLGFKAQATVDASVAKVYATILDVNEAHKWIPSTKSVSMIDQDNQTGRALLHYIIDMPFPLTDRDMVIKSNVSKDAKGNLTIDNVSVIDSRKPEQKGLIRITNYHGKWTLKNMGKNKTLVTLSGHADPRGGIPSWVANMFVTKQPYEMLMSMRKQVKNPRYNDAVLP